MKTLRTVSGLVLLAAGAIAAGCTNTEVANTNDPLADATGFCEAFAQAKCSAAVVTNCYHAGDAQLDVDTAHCVAAVSAADRCNPNNLPYHPENAAAALDTIGAIFADGQIDGTTADTTPGATSELQDYNAALDSVFYKADPNGSDCSKNSDCDIGNGSTCVLHAGRGVCAVPVETGPGLSCVSASAQCTTGFYCDDHSHCVVTQEMNAACSRNDQCFTKVCGDSGRCTVLARDAASCQFDSECAGGFCSHVTGDTKNGVCGSYDDFSQFSQSCQGLQ